MPVTIKVEGIDKLVQSIASLPDVVYTGVKVRGPASKYALVWEWGSARLTKPGPKTTWSINPAGQQVILTLTAPFGWIRINRHKYLDFLREEWLNTHFTQLPLSQWGAAAADLMLHAATRAAALMADTAPIDSGELRANIVPVGPNDSSLAGTPNAHGPTELDLGQDWMK